jgi:hypothetical protein
MGGVSMKKMLIALILMAFVYGSVENTAIVNASTGSITGKSVSIELTINSPGASGSQFILKGLQTPATPYYSCAKTETVTDAFGNGTSVHFALLDLNGVNTTKITVKGTVVGRLSIINDTYVDQSGKSIAGRVSVKQLR